MDYYNGEMFNAARQSAYRNGQAAKSLLTDDDSAPARLSQALMEAGTGLSLGDSFFDTVFRAAGMADRPGRRRHGPPRQ